MTLRVEQHNIKATLTAHGFNDWSEVQKIFHLNKVIKTNLVNTCPANISRSASLRDDFSAAARHVAEFLVIMKSCDPGSNLHILVVDTD